MSTYSLSSQKRLESCHPDLQTIFFYVILDYDNTIVCGHRGQLEQEEAVNSGHSQLNWPDSKHNQYPSNAVDAVPYEDGHLDYSRTQSAHFAGYVLGVANMLFRMGQITHKIRCGVDWDMDMNVDDGKFFDACHFELIEP